MSDKLLSILTIVSQLLILAGYCFLTHELFSETISIETLLKIIIFILVLIFIAIYQTSKQS
jgi:membrane-bound ClpP family serine protease